MLLRQIIYLSLVSLAIGWIIWRRGYQLFKKWKKSEAIIIKNIYIPNELALFKPNNPEDDENGTYYAVVEFNTDKNKTITKQLDIGGYPPREVGERMMVIYDLSNPINFIIYPRMWFIIIPRLLVAIGLIGLIVSMVDLLGVVLIIPD